MKMRTQLRKIPLWIRYILKGKFGHGYRQLRVNMTRKTVWIKKVGKHNFKLYTRNSNNKNLYVNGTYTDILVKYIEAHLASDAIFIDIGANIGYFSVIAASKCKAVYSFEPVNDNYKILEDNIALNNLDNVFPQQKAISDDSFDKIYLSKFGHGLHNIKARVDTTHSNREQFFSEDNYQEIQTIGIDDFIDEWGIDPTQKIFIKSDAEAHEDQVFRSMPKLLGQNNIEVVFEFTKTSLYENEIESIFNSFEGYDLFVMEIDPYKQISRDEILAIDTPIVLNIRAERRN